MALDLAQFHQTFFEESLEGLDEMESGLLHLDVGATDVDVINTIFRAAHSIKGGSATFGFSGIAKFTHVMETLLDEMRGGKRAVTQDAVDLLLESVDCLRAMFAGVQHNTEVDQARVADLQARLDAMQGGASAAPGAAAHVAETQSAGWVVNFRALPHLLCNGNDPVRLFKELQTLGDMRAVADMRRVPPFEELQPEQCYLAWDITLAGAAKRADVADVFAWVEGDCELSINPLGAAAHNTTTMVSPPASAAADIGNAPVFERRVATLDRRSGAQTDATSIRVGIDKVDTLVNMVGELVITQSMLSQLSEDFEMGRMQQLRDGLAQLQRNTRELQESVMRIRMLPMSFVFNRFPRMVHDLSQKLGKKVELKMAGEQTELDKTVMEKIGDPLVHLVRNSLDHGIEAPAARRAAGKPETGVLKLDAYHKGGNIIIEISDDGAGINKQKVLKRAVERGLVKEGEALPDEKIYELIFMPGFSTAEVVSDVSGRGVGMDVVLRNIKSLGGAVEIASREGRGTTISIRLPLTLAILDGMSISVADQIFIIPLTFIVESLQPAPRDLKTIADQGRVVQVRGEYLPLVALHRVFGIDSKITDPEQGILVLLEAEGKKIALLVDALVGQHQVVLKSLESNYRKVDGVAGATIMGDGRVALILDVASLVRLSKRQ
ncbi:MAG: chemotaxis protein CheA [Pseudomonadota bacterium]